MVTHLKELSEDEKIRQQCAARDDYERRLIGEYNRGEREGRRQEQLVAIKTLIFTMKLTADQAMDALMIPENERAELISML